MIQIFSYCFAIIHHQLCQNTYLRGKPRHSMKKTEKCWDISVLMKIIGSQVCRNMLFVHAVLGCEATSHIYRVGKGQTLEFILTSEVVQEQAEVFINPVNTKSDTVAAGETAIVFFIKANPLTSQMCSDSSVSIRR